MFTILVKYKVKLTGKELVRIDKFYPSSKSCWVCGPVKQDLKVSGRVYTCQCGNLIDRDLNASINIKNQGKLLLNY